MTYPKQKPDSHILSSFCLAEYLICWHIAWFGVKRQYFSGVVRCEGPLVDIWQGAKAIGAGGAPAQGQCRPQPHSEEGRQDGKAHRTSHDNHHLRLTISLDYEEIYVLWIDLGFVLGAQIDWIIWKVKRRNDQKLKIKDVLRIRATCHTKTCPSVDWEILQRRWNIWILQTKHCS